MSIPLHIIILAAGDGTRMKSHLPKVLLPVAGQAMLTRVADCAARLSPAQVHVVYNPETPIVQQALQQTDADRLTVNWVAQAERLGTGHAVQQAIPDIPDEAQVMVLYGDLPLLTPAALEPMLTADPAALKVLTMHLDDPYGYGRIVRNADGHMTGIVEQKDADATQKKIQEVNSGIMLMPAKQLKSWVSQLETNNRQAEYYLTDVVAIADQQGVPIEGLMATDATDLMGANDATQLAELEHRFRSRQAAALMRNGVRLADPARIDVRGTVKSGRDVSIDINVILEGAVVLGDGVSIGPGSIVRNCNLAAGTRVHAYSVLEDMRTLGACDIGPFARVRPGTELGSGSRVGNFVEVKNTVLGEGSKASHLSYLGDSEIGRNVNIGAGTITCNYDGANKHRTEIEDDVFVGSDTQFIAPVKVGKGANIGAGSTITKDVPEGKLTLSRAKQVTIAGWKRPHKDRN